MEVKGIDVSAHQGNIDWKTVADYGMGFAILRVTEKGDKVDSQFEANLKGCRSNGIPIGVYKYSYALTVSEAQAEAEKAVEVLNGRGLDYPVFYDLEWSDQRNLGKAKIEEIALAFLTRIKKAGYQVGLYCNSDWYKNALSETLKEYDCWVAAYPSNDNGTMQTRLKPSYGIGWQYSQAATIPGINTKVDRDVFWKDYTSTKTEKGGSTMTETEAKSKLIEIAKAEIGYLEKKSNRYLDDKTKNAGSNNYTKYWRDIKPSYQGQPWCACFVTWCMVQAFGKEHAEKLLKHYPYVYCPTMANLFTLNANPKVGDIVIFKHSGTFTHTGIVIAVNGDKFTTIEGNTSNGSTIVANGGAVCQKTYSNSKLPGTKFCTPDWSIVTTSTTATSSDLKYGSSGEAVKTLQNMLIACGYSCGNSGADGSYGNDTVSAVKSFQSANNLTADGIYGSATKAKLEAVYAEKTAKKSDSSTPSKDRKFVGRVTAYKLNVRTQPSKTAKNITSYPTLGNGNLVDVCDTVKASDGSEWYYIRIASKYYGYCAAAYIAKN